jgi:hypothetical protein
MADRTVSVKLKADVASYMASMRAAGAATHDLEKAARDVRKAHDEEADAAGAVRVAEAQLAELRGKSTTKTSQLAAAEERLAKSYRTLEAARNKTASAEQSFLQLQEKAGADAGDAFGKGYERETSKVAARANAQFSAMMAAGLAVGGGAAAGVGALISAAAIAGTTAALLGFGVSAAATDQRVQFAMGDMSASINQDMKDISGSLKGPVITDVGRIRDAFHNMAPEIKRDMAAVAPALDQVTSGVINMARAALPGVSAFANSSESIFRGVRVVLEDTGAGFTDFATNVSGSSVAVEKDLDILGRVVAGVLGSLGGVVSNLASNTQAIDVIGRIIQEAAHTLELLTANGGAAMSVLGAFGGTAAGLINILNGVLSVLNMLPSGMTEIIGMLIAGGAAAKALGFNMNDAFTKGGASATGFKAKLGQAVAILTVVGSVARLMASDVKYGQTSVDGLSDSLSKWQKTGTAAGDLTKLFGGNLKDLGDSFTVLKNDQDGWLEGFTDFVGNLIGVDSRLDDAKSRINQLDDALASMVRNNNGAEAAQVIQKIADQTGRSVAEVTAQLPQFQAAQKEAAGATQQNAAAIKDLGARAQTAAGLVDTLTGALNNLIQPELDSREAARNLEQAIDDATQSIKDNGTTLDINTEKGRNNQQALDGIASSTNSLVQSLVKGGKSQRDIAAAMDEGRQSFIDTATAMHMPREQAEQLATQLGLISSKDWQVAVGANVMSATDSVNNFVAFASAQSATAKVFGDTNPATGAVKDWQNVTSHTDGNTTTYTYTDPATQAVTQWKVETDATGAKTTTYSLTDPATGAVYSWQQFANGTWGTVHVGADTATANSAIDNAARDRTATIVVNAVGGSTFRYASGAGGVSVGMTGPRAKGGLAGGPPYAPTIIKAATGGSLGNALPGGLVRGPGTSTSDSVMLAASAREYVVNASATAQWLPLLQAINSGMRPTDNAVQQVIRSGDAVKGSPTSTALSSSVVNNFSFPNYVGSREELVGELRKAVRIKGGDVQKVLGRG